MISSYLQAAKTKQRIREENMEITVIERSQQIQVQEQEITRRERELDAQVKKPAEAEKFRLEKLAEANRWKMVKDDERMMKVFLLMVDFYICKDSIFFLFQIVCNDLFLFAFVLLHPIRMSCMACPILSN